MKKKEKEWFEGKGLGKSIFLKERVARSGYNEKYTLECKKCGKTKTAWVSQIYEGNWKVCEHDLD